MEETQAAAEQVAPKPLTEIFNPSQDIAPEPAPEPEPEVVEKAEPETVEEPGETAAPEEGPEQPDLEKPEPEAAKDPWTKTAYLSEKRKRQELERRLDAIENQQAKAPDEPAPDMFEDPEGYQEHQDKKIEAVKEVAQNSAIEATLRVSRAHVLKEYGEEKLEEAAVGFELALQRNPSLQQKALESESPYQFIYDTGVAELNREAMGDPAAYAAKVADEAMKKAEAEIEKRVAERVKAELAKHLPQSLAEEQSQGERTTEKPQWGGPKSINQILKGRR